MAAEQTKAQNRARGGSSRKIDAESFTANVIKMSNYQADPLAATIQNRTIGLSKLNVTKEQIEADKNLFGKQLKVKGDMRNGQKRPDIDNRSTTSSAIVAPKIL